MSYIKKIVKRIIYPNHYSSEAYVKYIRKGGATIGNGTFFYAPQHHPVDESSLPFVEIGENCRITEHVEILAHDYSYAVLRPTHNVMLTKTGVTKIGSNVFIGVYSIIMSGTTIGDNVIIGSGSLVTGQIPSNVVIGGNPAKIICTLDEYYEKLSTKFEDYAKCYYLRKSRYLCRPLEENEMIWYVCLWKTTNSEARRRYLSTLKVDGDDSLSVVRDVMNYKPKYKSYKDFLDSFFHEY